MRPALMALVTLACAAPLVALPLWIELKTEEVRAEIGPRIHEALYKGINDAFDDFEDAGGFAHVFDDLRDGGLSLEFHLDAGEKFYFPDGDSNTGLSLWERSKYRVATIAFVNDTWECRVTYGDGGERVDTSQLCREIHEAMGIAPMDGGRR